MIEPPRLHFLTILQRRLFNHGSKKLDRGLIVAYLVSNDDSIYEPDLNPMSSQNAKRLDGFDVIRLPLDRAAHQPAHIIPLQQQKQDDARQHQEND